MKRPVKLASIMPQQPVNTIPQPEFPSYGGVAPIGGQVLRSKPLKPVRLNTSHETVFKNKSSSGPLSIKTAKEIVSEYIEKK